MKRNHLTFLAIISSLTFSVLAQSSQKPLPAIAATVGEVTDTRSTGSFFSECKVQLKFFGDAAADAQRVSAIRLIKAEDELGRDLRPDKENLTSMNSHGRSSTLEADVKLRNPSRKASAIKILQGEVDLFSPTEANGGIHILKNLLGKPGEPISDAALKKMDVQIMYLTKESYEAKKKELQAKNSAGNQAGAQLNDAFDELFKGMFGSWVSDSKDAVNLYLSDPHKRVLDLELEDGQGKPLKTRGSMTSKSFKRINLAAPAPADTQVKLYLATPEAVKTYSFKVENIPLP